MRNVFALCARDWQRSSQWAAGVTPVTSPPHDAISLNWEWVARHKLLYFNLHGFQSNENWYGQYKLNLGPILVTPDHVSRVNWDNCLIFAEVCFGAQSEITAAFLQHGAAAVISSTGEAYGRIRPTGLGQILSGRGLDGEADRLFHIFRLLWANHPGEQPADILAQAKRIFTLLSTPLDADDQATIDSFVCLTPHNPLGIEGSMRKKHHETH